MVVSKAQKRAIRKYAQTKKGQVALQRAHQKRTQTEDYREYQRQKQADYRRIKREQGTSIHTSPAKPVQEKNSALPAHAEDVSRLDTIIKRFEADLRKQMSHQGLSYETLPSSYQRVLDALRMWKAEPSEN